jgi:hypothetical protein
MVCIGEEIMARRTRSKSSELSEKDKSFLAFGRAMAAWASLESGLYAWFEHVTLLDTRKATPLYYSATNFKSRLDLLRAAMQSFQIEDDELKFLTAAIKRAVEYNGFRNKLAHGEFTFEGLIIESKHPDRKIARDTAIDRSGLDIAAQNFRALAELMWEPAISRWASMKVNTRR